MLTGKYFKYGEHGNYFFIYLAAILLPSFQQTITTAIWIDHNVTYYHISRTGSQKLKLSECVKTALLSD